MLVNCVAYIKGHKIADISIPEISEYLKIKDCLVWVALKDPDDGELQTMRIEFNLHELAVEDARNGHQRPKIEEYGDSLFVVLHTVDLGAAGKLNLGEVDLFVGPNYVLSIRNNSAQSFVNVRERCEREPEQLKYGSAFVLYAIMDTIVDRYFPVLERLEDELEKVEERIFSKSVSARLNLEEVYVLKRKLMLVQHATVPLIESLGKLHGGRVPQICSPMQDYFRDVSDHVIRISKSVDGIREMSTTIIQVNLSLISLSESEVTKKLAAYGALFAVPTAIAGIYGMNFKFMPELEWMYGYPITLALIFFTDIFLWFRFKNARWL